MEELKAPIQEHRCETIEECEFVSIAKRSIDGKPRWMWERSQKDGKIVADEITCCPYCGISLDDSALESKTSHQKFFNPLEGHCVGCLHVFTQDVQCKGCIRNIGECDFSDNYVPDGKNVVFKDGTCPKCGGATNGEKKGDDPHA